MAVVAIILSELTTVEKKLVFVIIKADKRTRFEYKDKVLNKTFNIKKTASIMSIIMLKDD